MHAVGSLLVATVLTQTLSDATTTTYVYKQRHGQGVSARRFSTGKNKVRFPILYKQTQGPSSGVTLPPLALLSCTEAVGFCGVFVHNLVYAWLATHTKPKLFVGPHTHIHCKLNQLWQIGDNPSIDTCANRCSNSEECLGFFRWTLQSGTIKCEFGPPSSPVNTPVESE